MNRGGAHRHKGKKNKLPCCIDCNYLILGALQLELLMESKYSVNKLKNSMYQS